ncbi:uncharacterized protein LOC119095519 isoform X1 [Pollicipes pollicipes]|uniref:uncharacterized protein LOC119095519 isoform X1 n=1 Tax=Pollicipes pollicipes TaxID=41117 RepID=UPI0018852F4A|nr:uncharacterized protein LOC119095519 isoform X1 [Pollicipes pollicipes]XP_037074262.1 uncharacterized protein LOC119095519 isoform X1 [Pollicipes pollicipes]
MDGAAVADGRSAADRRREARQRKILENAQSRMSRLCGRSDAAEPVRNHAPPAEELVGPAEAAEACPDPPDQPIHEILRRAQRDAGWPAGAPPPNVEDLFRQLNGQAPPAGVPGDATDGLRGASMSSVWWQRWDQHRWVVVALLALLTRLSVLAGLGALISQNVLVPFFVLETTSYVIRLCSVPLRPNMGLLGTALMLCGVSPRTLDLWGRYITFLSQAWNDFMVYAFVLVLSFRMISPAAVPETTGSAGQPAAAPPSTTPPPPIDELEFEF